MLDNGLIDICLALVTFYLVLSIICSSINETLASILKWRSENLRTSVTAMLESDMAERLYHHELIKSLGKPKREVKAGESPRKLPSYIDAKAFRGALIDILDRDTRKAEDITKPVLRTVDEIAAAVERLDDTLPFKRTLMLAAADAQTLAKDQAEQLALFEAQVEDWFDRSMERATGWYKRRTQWVIFAIAGVLVVGMNADTLKISKTLWDDQELRGQLVQISQKLEAGEPASDAEQAQVSAALDALPIGYQCTERETLTECVMRQVSLRSLVGWVITVIAVSFGAPFWYGVLSNLSAIKGAGQKPPTAEERRTRKIVVKEN